ncbi:MAG: M23 family metallopeptidase [Clostridia bacterium]|nr:M23 family metallopeptidase [Clostridia bacterium]
MIYNGKFKVTSPFGSRVLNGKPDDHKGIDVVGLGDKHVCAVVSGTVAASTMILDKSDRTWEWGNYVRVDGVDGRRYYYCHLSKRLVKAGQQVKVGDHLGIEGNTGYSFGSHCHFEVRENGVSSNPAPFLGIPNKAGTYGTDWRAEVQKKFGLSKDTMTYLDKYKYAADLYMKLGKA